MSKLLRNMKGIWLKLIYFLSNHKEFFRFLKFLLFSISAGAIETLLFFVLGLFFDPIQYYYICYLPALIASVIWNFTLNRRFTFKSAANVPLAMLKVFAYYAVFTPLSTILGNWLVNGPFLGVPLISSIVYFASLVVNFVTEFLFQRYFVFRGKLDNRAPLLVQEQVSADK